MVVLSLFDGISTGRFCLEKAGVKVDRYFASEIDKKAIKISEKNWNDVIQLGDIEKIDIKKLPKIDLLIGGSPCQGFSRNGKGMNFDDPRSKLFFKFKEVLDTLKEENPDLLFILENVQMKKEWEEVITEMLGVKPLKINSKVLTAQNRPRTYWVNFDVPEPEDAGVNLISVIDRNIDVSKYIRKEGLLIDKKISKDCINIVDVVNGEVRVKQATNQGYIIAEEGDGVNLSFPKSKHRRGRVIKRKSPTLDCNCDVCVYHDGIIRKLSIGELEQLQTLPRGYTECEGVSEGDRKKAIGNGWTADVIVYIMKNMLIKKEFIV